MECSVASTSQSRIGARQSAGEAAPSGLLFASMSGVYTRWTVVVVVVWVQTILIIVTGTLLKDTDHLRKSRYTVTRWSVVHREGGRVTLVVFITDLLDHLWTPVHVPVAPALRYKLFRCYMCPQFAGPTLREVTTYFRQRNCVWRNVNTVTFLLAGVCDRTTAASVCSLLNVSFQMSVLVRMCAFYTGLNYLYTCVISEVVYFPYYEVMCEYL
jgi:hypothetical protein